MHKTIKFFLAAGACAALLLGPGANAQTTWKPPAEIAPKAEPGAQGTQTAPAAAAQATPQSPADKEKSCHDQAKARGLKGKAKKQFKADCMKS